MASQNWDWVFHALGWALAGLGLLLALWALFWDRSRGRKRCPKCWYSMEGAVEGNDGTLTCPECGTANRSVRLLHKTRRRERWVAMSLVIGVAAYSVSVVPAVRKGGWPRAVPSSILVLVAPVGEDAWRPSTFVVFPFDGPRDPMLIELVRRAQERELSHWQWRVLLDRFYRTNETAGEQLVWTRDRWPAHHDVTAYVNAPWFISLGAEDIIARTRLDIPGSQWIEHKLGIRNPRPVSDWVAGATGDRAGLIAIEYELLIGATVQRNDSGSVTDVDASTAKRVWSGVARTVQVGGTPAEIMTPVENDVTDKEMARFLSPALRWDEDGRVLLTLRTNGYHPTKRMQDWALGFSVEVLHSGEVVATGSVQCNPVTPGMLANMLYMWMDSDLKWLGEPPAAEDLDEGTWSIRLISDPDVAVFDYSRDSYWVGEIEVPARRATSGSHWSFK